MNTRLLVLDFDGTLADTAGGITATMAATFEALELPVPAAAAVRQTIGLPLTQSVALLAGNDAPAFVERATDTYRRLFETIGVRATGIFPHVADTLGRLHAEGLTLTIATSRGGDSVRALCRNLGIAPYLADYVADEDVPNKKPAPDAVRLLLERTGIPAAETLVVGDTTYDIDMGRAAGCRTCGVTYGNHSAQQLADAAADWLIGDFAELQAVL